MDITSVNVTGEGLRVLLEAGFILREASRFDDAEAIFRGCIELMPDSEVPLVALGTVYLQKGDHAAALEYCASAFRKKDSPYARLHLGEALVFNGRPDEAREQLECVIADEPGSSYAETAKRMLDAAGIG